MGRKCHRQSSTGSFIFRFMNALSSCHATETFSAFAQSGLFQLLSKAGFIRRKATSPMKTLPLFTLLVCCANNVSAAQSLPAVPRFDGLGRHHHEITTRWALAQRYFD